jgi:multidrug efflux system membrane fusion protein
LFVTAATSVYLIRWRDPAPANGGFGRRDASQVVPVRAVEVQAGSIDVTVDALGTVTAGNTVVVQSRVDGLLRKIDFEEGREVQAGAVLAEIDPRPFQATLDQVQGQLTRDEALLAGARSDLSRYQMLLEQDSIAKQQVEDQSALVQQYLGAVQADRGAVATARLQVEWTHITAPISGRVGLRQVDVGNMVHAADANGVVVLTQTRPINVVFAVPANRAPEITRSWQGGAALVVVVYGRDGVTQLAQGRLVSADNVVDPATSTVKLKALFDNADGALLPNQFVNARLTVSTLENQVLIPPAAVQRGSSGTFVYVVRQDATVGVQSVTLGTASADIVAVTAGLKPGNRVVVDGTDKLRDGAHIESAVDAPAARPHRKGERAKS